MMVAARASSSWPCSLSGGGALLALGLWAILGGQAIGAVRAAETDHRASDPDDDGTLGGESTPVVAGEGAKDEDDFAETRDAVVAILAPRRRVILSAKVAATVRRLYRRLGESFDEGDPLVQFDDTLARIQLERMEAKYRLAEAELASKSKLFRDKAISTIEYQRAQAAVRIAESERTMARKEVADCRVLAPVAGRVERLLVEEHEEARPGDPLLEIVDDRVLLARILLPAEMLDAARPGRRLVIGLEHGPRVAATVRNVSPVIDAANNTVRVLAAIPNDDGALRAGMRGVVLLPASAGARGADEAGEGR